MSVFVFFFKLITVRESYSDSHGDILIGKLLEDIDATAGNIAFKHCYDNNPQTRPLNIVTAAVDTIKMSQGVKSLPAHDDIVLSGEVYTYSYIHTCIHIKCYVLL